MQIRCRSDPAARYTVRMPPALTAGPYVPLAVRRGDRVTCLYQDGDCVVTA